MQEIDSVKLLRIGAEQDALGQDWKGMAVIAVHKGMYAPASLRDSAVERESRSPWIFLPRGSPS